MVAKIAAWTIVLLAGFSLMDQTAFTFSGLEAMARTMDEAEFVKATHLRSLAIVVWWLVMAVAITTLTVSTIFRKT